jgi:hypothetical protein
MLGLGTMLVLGAGAWGKASAASPASAQLYRGQVEAIRVDRCGPQPGTCTGSLVLAQVRGQEVTLAIPAGTTIQRGDERVYLEQVGVGNYVTVQAVPLMRDAQDRGRFLDEKEAPGTWWWDGGDS